MVGYLGRLNKLLMQSLSRNYGSERYGKIKQVTGPVSFK